MSSSTCEHHCIILDILEGKFFLSLSNWKENITNRPSDFNCITFFLFSHHKTTNLCCLKLCCGCMFWFGSAVCVCTIWIHLQKIVVNLHIINFFLIELFQTTSFKLQILQALIDCFLFFLLSLPYQSSCWYMGRCGVSRLALYSFKRGGVRSLDN